MDVAFHIDEFDAEGLRPVRGRGGVRRRSARAQGQLLELIAAVHAADGEIDFAEDDHMRAVGAALGLPPESFKELVVDIIEEIDLGDDLERLRYG